ncbi:hypothetical protein GY45DRAFT_128938 [Cubamyces sp. BRFM 1775]|nr:hypothetical protein GY45DRAFT_128938 [Cubamyces sp. BRFM 1775]
MRAINVAHQTSTPYLAPAHFGGGRHSRRRSHRMRTNSYSDVVRLLRTEVAFPHTPSRLAVSAEVSVRPRRRSHQGLPFPAFLFCVATRWPYSWRAPVTHRSDEEGASHDGFSGHHYTIWIQHRIVTLAFSVGLRRRRPENGAAHSSRTP